MIIAAVAGVSRSGKNTFCRLLQKRINVIEVSFATKLKSELFSHCFQNYGIDIFHCTPEEKELIRPLMVLHNKIQKQRLGELVWVNHLERVLWDISVDVIASDLRYVYEADWVHNKGGLVVHLKKLVNGAELPPANEEEQENDTKTLAKADYKIVWPATDDLSVLESYVDRFIDFLNARRAKSSSGEMSGENAPDNRVFVSGNPS